MFSDVDIRKIILDELRLTDEEWPERVLNQIRDGNHGLAWQAVINSMYRAYEQGRRDEAGDIT